MAMLAVFPACERKTCRMQQVLDGGTKVGVIAVSWLVAEEDVEVVTQTYEPYWWAPKMVN